ncbi:HipA family kinase [Zwartia vadi]|uniref:HipA family kinase n=1 Tax=Zwartia vadi TaxID=3058168 RepID=UPI0025B28E30|nr:hypothetical protein [Zwartia vadi]MDN3987002.1 hypothetical protein [Zwartia vadi]
MIDILPSSSWREFRGEPPNKGLNLTTHLALVEDPNGKLHECYVKICPQNWPSPITEAIGWQLIRALNLPAPDFAALIMIPMNRLRQSMKLDHHWLNYNHPETLAFCVSAVEGRPLISSWKWIDSLRKKNAYKKAEVAAICAFDHWIDNKDRNTGNLLKKKNGEHVAIDNEYILYDLLWNGKFGFEIGEKTILSEAKQILNTKEFDSFKVAVAHHGGNHLAALIAIKADLSKLIFTLLPDRALAQQLWDSLDTFMTARADAAWLPAELGVIAQ